MTVSTTNQISMRKTRDGRPCGKLLSWTLCVLLALPGLAAAKKPSARTASTSTGSTTTTNDGCTVLLPAYIETGNTFSVKVVRVPGYPGGWMSPTIYLDVVYPATDASILTQNNTQTINSFDVTYATASFFVPSMKSQSIASSPTSPDATATVTATISEPFSSGKAKVSSTCSASTPVMGVN